ncbi:hypothetical protein DW668_04785 [Bacteroides stercoris]|jgi:hypothetical protein|uniref:Uncharacterized protein n=1 Tax=Bacteroides stercoris TaxID=46506 RepID=A0A414Q842_BACSE|nr:hypothetical protein [Bacteroides stercoris]UWI17977.1 MAG: hypothetical protein [Bacteriophage sp.]DAP87749.1 MAG TPA: hypothetical protein [Caudoviricetes sp.]MBV3632305.1 hypothetical protein [Bacteroides stercoris]MBV3676552.1 hypothetical protein [Bacteroides stercoris]RHF76907.1 hypothetical protein DW668_04785 [Bacteroides stercoris]
MKPITTPHISIPIIGIPVISILTIGFPGAGGNKPHPFPDGGALLLANDAPLLLTNGKPILLTSKNK